MPMITFADVIYEYPGHRALRGVSGAIEAGTVTALVGPNGAGKTTLLRCLAALDPPFSGRIEVDGIDMVAEPRRGRRHVGFLQDLFGLYDDLTARRCLRHAAAARGVVRAEIDGRIDDVARRLDLAPLLDKRAGALSRGQRQRLAIGQTIIHRPPVLLLDEPAAGLDPQARGELSALLRSLRAEGMTLIVSSHILSELQDYSTHLMLVDGGRIVDHRPLQGAAGNSRRLALDVASAVAEAVRLLADYPGAEDVATRDGTVTFAFAGDRDAQAALVQSLVNAGVKVVALGEARESLQAIYLDRVASRTGRA